MVFLYWLRTVSKLFIKANDCFVLQLLLLELSRGIYADERVVLPLVGLSVTTDMQRK